MVVAVSFPQQAECRNHWWLQWLVLSWYDMQAVIFLSLCRADCILSWTYHVWHNHDVYLSSIWLLARKWTVVRFHQFFWRAVYDFLYRNVSLMHYLILMQFKNPGIFSIFRSYHVTPSAQNIFFDQKPFQDFKALTPGYSCKCTSNSTFVAYYVLSYGMWRAILFFTDIPKHTGHTNYEKTNSTDFVSLKGLECLPLDVVSHLF